LELIAIGVPPQPLIARDTAKVRIESEKRQGQRIKISGIEDGRSLVGSVESTAPSFFRTAISRKPNQAAAAKSVSGRCDGAKVRVIARMLGRSGYTCGFGSDSSLSLFPLQKI
jgi:hypothetical protein